MRQIRLLLLGMAVSTILPSNAAELYLEHKEVTKSSHYTGTTGSARVDPIPNSWWIMEHSDDAAELGIRDQGFVIEDEQLTTLVYGVANKLLAQWPGNAPPIAIFVQGDRSPLSYGAQTTYYGEIFINYGVFRHAESEDEVAAVVGHELAHVLLGHGETIKYKKSVEKSLQLFTEARELYAKADALQYNETTEEYSLDPSVEGKMKRSAVQKVIADRFYKSAHATLFSRGNEQDADRLALDLMVAAGYSPMGLKASLERMAHSHDLSTEISDYLTTSSTSLLQESLTAVSNALDKNSANPTDLDQYFDGAKDEFADSALDFGKKALIEFSSKSHPVPGKRVEQITDYLYANYSRKIRRRRPDTSSAADFQQGHIGDLIERYTVANQAVQAVGLGDLAVAQELSIAALTPPASDHPYTRYAAFVTGRAQGDQQSMVVNAESINPDMLMPVFASVVFADFLSTNGKGDEADSMMSLYESYYGTVNDYYPPKIRMSISEFELEEAEQLAQECFAVAAPDSPLSNSCAQESGILRPAAGSGSDPGNASNTLNTFFKGMQKK